MPLWLLALSLFGLVKIMIASLMLWLPFRADAAVTSAADEERPSDSGGSDDEGGSRVQVGAPIDPHPRLPLPPKPRRGPHGSPSPSSPARVRGTTRRVIARSLMQR